MKWLRWTGSSIGTVKNVAQVPIAIMLKAAYSVGVKWT